MLCIEGASDFFDVLLTFAAFLLVFAIGLGLGFLTRGPLSEGLMAPELAPNHIGRADTSRGARCSPR